MSYYNPLPTPSTPSVYENERGELVVDEYLDPTLNPMNKVFKKIKTNTGDSSSGRGSNKSRQSQRGGRNDYVQALLPPIKNPPSWAALNTPSLGVVKRCYGCDQGWGKDLGGVGGDLESKGKSLWTEVEESLDENIFTCGAMHAVNDIFEIIQSRRLAHDSSYTEGAYEEFSRADIINHLDKHSANLKWRLRRQLDRTSALLARLMAGDAPPPVEGDDYEDELKHVPLFSKEERETYIKLQDDQRKTLKEIEALKKSSS